MPLDHADPDGPRITLAVSRISSARPELRRGVLLMIPGGPGGSGLNNPSSAAKRLPQSVLDRYDLVGFDPRGVGRSTPVDCGLAHTDLSMVKLRPGPAPTRRSWTATPCARPCCTACTPTPASPPSRG